MKTGRTRTVKQKARRAPRSTQSGEWQDRVTTIPTETWVLPRPRPDAFVGSFPLHFEQKLVRLVAGLQGRGDWEYGAGNVLHPFGGLAEIGDWVDLNETTTPTYVGDAHDLRALGIEDESYDLVILDPPYSDDEAALLYGTPPLRPAVFIAEAVRVCRVGGHVALYHRHQPKRPPGTKLVHRIIVLTRTGHAPRVCFVFQRMPATEIAAFEAGHQRYERRRAA